LKEKKMRSNHNDLQQAIQNISGGKTIRFRQPLISGETHYGRFRQAVKNGIVIFYDA